MSRTAPQPYSGENGPHTSPTRLSTTPNMTKVYTVSSTSPSTDAIRKMMMYW